MLLRVEGRNYVVTAAHIADELDANALYISGTVGAELVQLVGVIRKTAPPPGGRRRNKIQPTVKSPFGRSHSHVRTRWTDIVLTPV
jgi:hypothetical protein